jgi:hypothetical protein
MASPNFHIASHSPVIASVMYPKTSICRTFSMPALIQADGLT